MTYSNGQIIEGIWLCGLLQQPQNTILECLNVFDGQNSVDIINEFEKQSNLPMKTKFNTNITKLQFSSAEAQSNEHTPLTTPCFKPVQEEDLYSQHTTDTFGCPDEAQVE